MKNWYKLVASAAIVSAFAVNAQNADQRKSVRQSLDANELGTLTDKYQRQFEADEAKVRQYLLERIRITSQDRSCIFAY